jgi:hypothetical protein
MKLLLRLFKYRDQRGFAQSDPAMQARMLEVWDSGQPWCDIECLLERDTSKDMPACDTRRPQRAGSVAFRWRLPENERDPLSHIVPARALAIAKLPELLLPGAVMGGMFSYDTVNIGARPSVDTAAGRAYLIDAQNAPARGSVDISGLPRHLWRRVRTADGAVILDLKLVKEQQRDLFPFACSDDGTGEVFAYKLRSVWLRVGAELLHTRARHIEGDKLLRTQAAMRAALLEQQQLPAYAFAKERMPPGVAGLLKKYAVASELRGESCGDSIRMSTFKHIADYMVSGGKVVPARLQIALDDFGYTREEIDGLVGAGTQPWELARDIASR